MLKTSLSKFVSYLVLFVALAASAESRAATHYYMVVLGTELPVPSRVRGDRHPRFGIRPRLLRDFLDAAGRAHTFATFLKVTDGRIEAERTVSWLPAPGYFWNGNEMPHRGIVPGMNYDLDQTLALSAGKLGAKWGPYEITEDFFRRADARVDFLNRRQTDYKMTVAVRERLREPAGRNLPGGAINCIIAVSDIGGYLNTGTEYGFEASDIVFNHFVAGRNVYPGEHPEILQLMRFSERAGRYRVTFP